jgi:hypothetical protein
MNKALLVVLVFVAMVFLFGGALFLIGASVASDYAVGGVMLAIALVLLLVVWRLQAASPTVVQQTFNVQMSGSGKMEQNRMGCRSCGAPLEEKDIKVVQGGLMVTCPYCKAVYALEEAPKW